MKLNDSQAALDFLETSGVKLQEGKENCADLAELETLGALVKKLRAEATERTIQCEAEASTKVWSCKAEFVNSGGEEEEATGFAIQLQYRVDDTSRTVQPDSLVCLMAG